MEATEKRKTLIDYFESDQLAADVWKSKYAIEGEKTPEDMHRRMARELARIEFQNYRFTTQKKHENLSEFGKKEAQGALNEDLIFGYFDKFKWIIPQGSIMSALGNKHKIQSLSNCFVIPSPTDSYGGIFKTDQEIAQLEKRRGGVGLNINTLRPDGVAVSNAAGTSTGAHSFMERYSNTTREVAQNGRRGALMLLMSCLHPDIFKFVGKKKDRTKVTGANISVQLTDKFMQAVKDDTDFYCEFPIGDCFEVGDYGKTMPYNTLEEKMWGEKKVYIMRIKARELFNEIVLNAWDNAEPGVAFIDRIHNYSPDGVYEQYKAVASNPCGEIFMQPYDACRLLAVNLFSFVREPWTEDAYIDFDKMYEVFYIQQRLADDIVDLELEHIERIINKINNDPEDSDTKSVELNLWQNVYNTTKASRRTGCGFTGLADMLAAQGYKYDSDEAIELIEEIMSQKMLAELDCTIDLAILRGTFEGYERSKEYHMGLGNLGSIGWDLYGENDFYKMLRNNFPVQCERMWNHGRRNVSWSTLAPTGTVSILTQTTSGIEPLFLPFYTRRRKVTTEDERIDFTDKNGDNWQEYFVLHPKFKEWIKWKSEIAYNNLYSLKKEDLQRYFEDSPWYKATANDISWEKRLEIQAVIQKYTTHSISSTLNLPKDITKETVSFIYKEAWGKGLKGVTIYRDGCRDGVLISESNPKFGYIDAIKRPKELEAQLHTVTVKGKKYAVIVGLLDEKPYEIFAFQAGKDLDDIKFLEGKVVKAKKGKYDFLNGQVDHSIRNIQVIAETGEEQVLTRLVSGMLRHGAKPLFCCEQIEKCDLEVISFGKAICRILKKYVKEEEYLSRVTCSNCGSSDVRMQEGCSVCNICGHSKCG